MRYTVEYDDSIGQFVGREMTHRYLEAFGDSFAEALDAIQDMVEEEMHASEVQCGDDDFYVIGCDSGNYDL